jgi:transcriptional regulator with XRE-family HTH domain
VTPPRTELGRLLKARRESLGYSRIRAAQLSGVNASSLEAWELGRVNKPPIHDVVRLARTLSISMEDLERTVMPPGVSADEPSGHADRNGDGALLGVDGLPLIERAIGLLGWAEADAAVVLQTTPERIHALREGDGELTVLEVVTLIGVLARFPAARGGASEPEIEDLLARLRRVPV